MNALLVTNSLAGGAGKACHRLYNALRAEGYAVRLLYLYGSAPKDGNIVRFYGKPSSLFLRQLCFEPKVRLEAALTGDALRRYKLPTAIHRLERHPLVRWADVINLHWVPGFLDYRRFFKSVGSKAVVWTMHDMLPFSGGYHYECDVIERNARLEDRIERTKAVATKGANLAIAAPSTWLLDVSRNHRPFKGAVHRRIFNCLPLDVYKPLDMQRAREIFDLPLTKRIVLFTSDGVARRRKGLTYLVEALSQLDSRGILALSIGSEPVPLPPDISYRHLGSLTDEVALSICYSCADVVVVPSIEENSPNTIIESFACGRPVVAFNVGGVGELISDPTLGELVTTVSSQALALAIKRSLETTFDPVSIRHNAVAHFSPRGAGRQYADLFESMLKR